MILFFNLEHAIGVNILDRMEIGKSCEINERW
jgi:hypothetical protein